MSYEEFQKDMWGPWWHPILPLGASVSQLWESEADSFYRRGWEGDCSDQINTTLMLVFHCSSHASTLVAGSDFALEHLAAQLIMFINSEHHQRSRWGLLHKEGPVWAFQFCQMKLRHSPLKDLNIAVLHSVKLKKQNILHGLWKIKASLGVYSYTLQANMNQISERVSAPVSWHTVFRVKYCIREGL